MQYVSGLMHYSLDLWFIPAVHAHVGTSYVPTWALILNTRASSAQDSRTLYLQDTL